MFPDLDKFTDPDKLRKLMANAQRLGHEDYAFQIQIRIAQLAGLKFKDPLEREFWTAVTCAEEIKTQQNGKTTKLAKTRLKHKKVGAMGCLADWAMEAGPTEGFQILVDHGRAELTGEAIVVRHAERFSAEVVTGAARKLEAQGISRDSIS